VVGLDVGGYHAYVVGHNVFHGSVAAMKTGLWIWEDNPPVESMDVTVQHRYGTDIRPWKPNAKGGYDPVNLHYSDGRRLTAGDIMTGDSVVFELTSGLVLAIWRCQYPACDCAVSFPEDYHPDIETECPKGGINVCPKSS
jgi:hypothetical protein